MYPIFVVYIVIACLALSWGYRSDTRDGWAERHVFVKHESGHAIAALACSLGRDLKLVALCRFSLRLGGRTELPLRKPKQVSSGQLWEHVFVMLAGRAAQENDDAWMWSGDYNLARSYVEELLCRQAEGQDISPEWWIGPNVSGSSFTSERILAICLNRAKALVRRHRWQLEAIAAALLRQGRLNREEILAIWDAPMTSGHVTLL